MKKRQPIGKQKIGVGDCVLLGAPGVTMPGDWWLGVVFWAGGSELLVSQGGLGGSSSHKQLHSMSMVRAVGTIAELIDFQHQFRTELKPLTDAVFDADAALRAARAAVYDRLDTIAAAEPLRNAGSGI